MKRQICPRCERPLSVCFCHCLKNIENRWPVWILQHHAEKKHAIGTAKIAMLGINNITCFNSRSVAKDDAFQSSIKSQTPILVYPGEGAKTLDQIKKEQQDLENPSPLLFLDGSWRKTHKMFYEFPELNELPRVSINPGKISNYRIRKEPNESAISTLEAIVYVLSTLENNEEKYQSLLDTMNWMIDKQIEYMGKDVYKKNYKKGEYDK